MEEYTRYGKIIMKNVRNILLDYKKKNHLTNAEMAQKCDMSISEYDKIMNAKKHSTHGCSADTLCKIHKNLKIDANMFFRFSF